MKIILLHDPVPPDAPPDVRDTLVQVAAVRRTLRELGHQTRTLALNGELEVTAATLRRLAPGLVFNLVEAVQGSGRGLHRVPALLERLRIPFTGAGRRAMRATGSKWLTKTRLKAAGIGVPHGYLGREQPRDANFSPGEYILKPVWEDASIGVEEDAVVRADTLEDLLAAGEKRAGSPETEWLAEVYVEGREFNVSLLDGPAGPEILPPAEIRFEDYGRDRKKVLGYRAKWEPDSFEYRHTTRTFALPESDLGLVRELRELADRCWRIFGLQGYARVDFRVDSAGRPCVLEINANPCLAPDSGFVAAARQGGWSYGQLINRIVINAMRMAERQHGYRG